MPATINIIVAAILLARGEINLPCLCGGDDESPQPAIKAPIGGPLPSTVKITRSNAFSSLEPSTKHYTVDCKLTTIATYKDPSNATLRRQPLDIPLPTIAVADGEMVTVQDTSTKTFFVARTDKGAVPITRDIWEGMKFEICVVSADAGKAVVDINAVMQSANGAGGDGKSAAANDGRPIRVQNNSGRMIECVTLGEKATATFEKRFDLEVVVKETTE